MRTHFIYILKFELIRNFLILNCLADQHPHAYRDSYAQTAKARSRQQLQALRARAEIILQWVP